MVLMLPFSQTSKSTKLINAKYRDEYQFKLRCVNLEFSLDNIMKPKFIFCICFPTRAWKKTNLILES